MLFQSEDLTPRSSLPKLLIYDERPSDPLAPKLKTESDFIELKAQSVEELIEIAYDETVDLVLLQIESISQEVHSILEYMRSVEDLKHIPVMVFCDNEQEEQQLNEAYEAIVYHRPLKLSSVINRLNVYFSLIAKTRELESSKHQLQIHLRHIQEILNSQGEMLAVFSDENIILANSRFLNFFKVETLEGFILEYDCFAKTFVQNEEGFFYNDCHDSINWIQNLQSLEHDRRNVVIKNTNGDHHRFRIQLQEYTLERKTFYIVTLFDMTDMYALAKKYEQFAYTDLLTGVANRRKFEDHLDIEMSRANRLQSALSMMIFDLDHFKSINDTYGHEKGDDVLRAFAHTISKRIRKEDLFARWGGEEFVLMVPNTALEDLFKLATQLLELTRTIHVSGDRYLTVSIGISHYENNMSKHDFIKLADEALYRAKESGRDRFEVL